MVRCLPPKHEYLSSHTWQTLKIVKHGAHVCNHRAGEAETGRSLNLNWSVILAESVRSMSNERLGLRKQGEGV